MVDVASVPALAETDRWEASVPELQNGWRPTGGPPNPASDEGLLNWPLQALANRTTNLKRRLDDLSSKAGDLVTVGAGGDHATINEALSALSEKRPAYVRGGFTTELRLLPGFVMAEQVLVRSVNLSWINITSVDAEVFIDRAYLVEQFGDRYPAFGGMDGALIPTIGCLFTMMATGTADLRAGIMLASGASGRVMTGAGIKSAGAEGITVNSSAGADVSGAIFSGAGADALVAGGGTRVTCRAADLSGAGARGIHASNGAAVQAGLAIVTGAATQGISAQQGATINAAAANARRGASDSTSDFVVAQGGMISANGSTGGTNVTVNTISASGIIFK